MEDMLGRYADDSPKPEQNGATTWWSYGTNYESVRSIYVVKYVFRLRWPLRLRAAARCAGGRETGQLVLDDPTSDLASNSAFYPEPSAAALLPAVSGCEHAVLSRHGATAGAEAGMGARGSIWTAPTSVRHCQDAHPDPRLDCARPGQRARCEGRRHRCATCCARAPRRRRRAARTTRHGTPKPTGQAHR